jgi:hypothetical protein
MFSIEVKKMIQHENKNGKTESENVKPENIKEILGVISSEVPGMIKSILSSVFSEEAGRNMGKAAAAYYKELKDGGLPEPVAVKMTEEYMRTFTSIGDMLKSAGKVKYSHEKADETGTQIEESIRKKQKENEEEE